MEDASDGVRAKDGRASGRSRCRTTAGNKSRELARQVVQPEYEKVNNYEMTIQELPASVVWGDIVSRARTIR